MVLIAHHLIVHGVGLGILAGGNRFTVIRTVQTVLHRSAIRLACGNKLPLTAIVGQLIGCRRRADFGSDLVNLKVQSNTRSTILCKSFRLRAIIKDIIITQQLDGVGNRLVIACVRRIIGHIGQLIILTLAQFDRSGTVVTLLLCRDEHSSHHIDQQISRAVVVLNGIFDHYTRQLVCPDRPTYLFGADKIHVVGCRCNSQRVAAGICLYISGDLVVRLAQRDAIYRNRLYILRDLCTGTAKYIREEHHYAIVFQHNRGIFKIKLLDRDDSINAPAVAVLADGDTVGVCAGRKISGQSIGKFCLIRDRCRRAIFRDRVPCLRGTALSDGLIAYFQLHGLRLTVFHGFVIRSQCHILERRFLYRDVARVRLCFSDPCAVRRLKAVAIRKQVAEDKTIARRQCTDGSLGFAVILDGELCICRQRVQFMAVQINGNCLVDNHVTVRIHEQLQGIAVRQCIRSIGNRCIINRASRCAGNLRYKLHLSAGALAVLADTRRAAVGALYDGDIGETACFCLAVQKRPIFCFENIPRNQQIAKLDTFSPRHIRHINRAIAAAAQRGFRYFICLPITKL